LFDDADRAGQRTFGEGLAKFLLNIGSLGKNFTGGYQSVCSPELREPKNRRA
jgi:hypothetical protein